MIVVPLTQASHRLGIDAKTLRRWLAHAQLPLHSDPQDARKKGVDAQHLLLLAHRHQRSLTSVSPDLSAPEGASPDPLPPSLLALPQQLCALQAQIAALEQQVAALSLLLQPRSVESAAPAPPPEKTRTRPGSPAASIPKTRPAAKTASKPVSVIPRVEYGEEGHYVVICPKHGLLPFEPDTKEWFAWVAEQDSFRFVGKGGHFTAHHEWRVPKGAWRAHRHLRNHSYALRLAPTQDLTLAILEQAATTLQAHLT